MEIWKGDGDPFIYWNDCSLAFKNVWISYGLIKILENTRYIAFVVSSTETASSVV